MGFHNAMMLKAFVMCDLELISILLNEHKQYPQIGYLIYLYGYYKLLPMLMVSSYGY